MSFELPDPADLDAARRISDAVSLALVAEGKAAIQQWMAFRISDGGTDGTLYPDRETAIRFQLHELQCLYLCITPDGINARDALYLLNATRTLYKAGYRTIDPEHVINPHIYKPGGSKIR